MSPRTTLALAVLVAALGAFVWFYEVEGAGERADAERTAREVFPELGVEDLTRIALRTPSDQEVVLEKREGAWRLMAPLDVPADAGAAGAAATAVADLVTEAVYDEPEALANYGLEGEATVEASAGEASYALVVGDATPTGGKTYVARPGEPEVYTVETYRVAALRKELDDLRDPRILDFDRDAVQEVEVRWPGGGVAATRGEAGWQLTEPLAAPADAGTIEGLLSDLSFLQAEAYRDDPEEEVAESSYRVVLRDREAVLADLRVAPHADGERRVVQGREDLVYEIAEARVADFPQTAVAFRFKEVSSFTASEARGFELDFAGEEPFTLRGTRAADGTWTTAPAPFAPGKAARLVSEASGLEAIDIAAETMGETELAGIGLAPPRVTVRVFAEGEGEEAPLLGELFLGRLEAGRGIAAQRPDDPVVYWLDESLAEHLPVSAEAFRNRFQAEEEPAQEAEPAPAEEAEPPPPLEPPAGFSEEPTEE